MSTTNPFLIPTAFSYPSLFNPLRFYSELWQLGTRLLEQQQAIVKALDTVAASSSPAFGIVIRIDLVELDPQGDASMKTVQGEVLESTRDGK